MLVNGSFQPSARSLLRCSTGPAGRVCRMGRRRLRRRVARRAEQMVRTTQRGPALGRESALQSVLQLPHVVLCLLQQRPQRLGYVGNPRSLASATRLR